jgi:hypothetical protein
VSKMMVPRQERGLRSSRRLILPPNLLDLQ